MFRRTALLIPLFFNLLFSQILDTIIRLPEPVGHLSLNPELNKIYVESRSGNVYVLNCSTLAVQTMIPTALIGYEAGCPLWCSRYNKYYLPGWSPYLSAIFVVDGLTDSIIRRLDIGVSGVSRSCLAYHRTADKLYVSGETLISVIDCAADSLLKTIRPAQRCWPGGFVFWDSIGNKVYVGSGDWSHSDWVMVVDCEIDSVIKIIRSRVGWPVVAGYSPLSRKLYVGGDGAYGVAVIDCEYDTVIKRFSNMYSDPFYLPVYASQVNKVYWASRGNYVDTIFVIDCDTDSIVRIIDKPLGNCIGMDCGGAYAEWSNRVYFPICTDSLILAAFDPNTDSLIGYARISPHEDYYAKDIITNPIDHKIYVSVYWDSAIYVFRDSLQGIAEVQIGSQVSQPMAPTFIRDFLLLSESEMGDNRGAVLMDVTGRKVLALTSGANDVRSLAPGVYFVRGQRGGSKATKVLITR